MRRYRTVKISSTLDEKKWSDGAKNNILFGEEQICYLSQKFRLSEGETIWAYYLQYSDEILEQIRHLHHYIAQLHTGLSSESECETGFS